MTPETWNIVKGVFDQAIELPAAGRRDLLLEIDPDVRLEVEKLIAAHEGDGDLLDEPIISFADGYSVEVPDAIGEYKIVREIGTGGMGSVYEAWRETDTFRQHAAIKIIRSGFNNSVLLNRFRAEQKILASLEHPFIARFLDGGETKDRQPYYAMEFVDGVSIAEYSRRPDVTLTQKLELFRKVCSAVSYAHSQLVIHRDLKPSNILVTSDGAPKLLDFGIAKVLEIESSDIETATQFGMMTPQYASPEQVRGEKVTTLSDVYSLGVILYESLTGKRPYETEGKNLGELLELVTQTVAARPSSVAASNGIARISSDIDNIVLKALQKDPNRRYSSVEQMSEDIRRYLAGLPITARPDTVGYRLKKFVERNRAAAAAGVLVFLTLVTGIGATTWQAVKAERQRALAEKRFADVRALANNVVFKYHDEIAKLEGSTGVREMLVTDATVYLDNLARDASNDPELERELALAYVKLGDVQGKLYSANTGNTYGAEESYRKAIGLLEHAVTQRPADIGLKDDLIKAYDAIVFLMARTYANGPEKKQIIDRSAEVLQQLLVAEPDNPKRLTQLATLYIRYGDSVGDLNNKNSLVQKLEHHSKALPLTEKVFDLDPNDTENLRNLARAYQRIGTDNMWLGENAELDGNAEEARSHFENALPFHRKMYETIERLFRLVPNEPGNKTYRLSGLMSYAETLGRNGQTAEALNIADECLKIATDIQTSDPNNREAKLGVAFANELFAKIYRFGGDRTSAAKYRTQALLNFEENFRGDNGNFEALNKVLEQCVMLAKLHDETGNSDQAAQIRKKHDTYMNIKINSMSAKKAR